MLDVVVVEGAGLVVMEVVVVVGIVLVLLCVVEVLVIEVVTGLPISAGWLLGILQRKMIKCYNLRLNAFC